MRLIDADELMEHVWRDKLDSRELIAEMIDNALTIKDAIISRKGGANTTREEAAKILYNQWQEFLEDNIDYAGISDAYKMAIGALDQESSIDKIRAEIEGYRSTIDNAISEDELKIEGMKEAYADCLKIIDKYKEE